jgi:rhodanese-related sulfurtransferase
MRKRARITIIFGIIFSLFISACASAAPQAGNGTQAGQATATAAAPAGAVTAPAATPGNLLPAQDVLAMFNGLLESIPKTQGYGYIQADALQADLGYTDKPFLLDVRNPSEVQANGYILSAVNIPLNSLLNNLDKLPAKNANIVIYSNSGYRSGMALAALMLLGYSDVHDLAGGFSSWVNASQYPIVTGLVPAAPQVLTPQPVITDQATYNMLDSFLSTLPDNYYEVTAITLSQELISANPPTLIDMNTTSDHQAYGYIPGAKLIGFTTFFSNLNQLPPKDAPIVIYAVGGGHSSILVMGLREMGYTNVYSLQGGILAWKATNLPVQMGGGN